MSDYLVRIISRGENLRGLACITTGLVNEAIRRHDAWPTAAAALGRALTAGTLMGALLKTGQRVALAFEGNGPLRKIIVEAESNGAVRGYVAEPHVMLTTPEGKLDVGRGIGRAGFLTVTKDLRLKEPYRSMVQLYTGEIGEDLALYLSESEQIPSAVGLGVFIDEEGSCAAAGGFLIQSLPPADEESVERLMREIEAMPPLSTLLREGKTPEEMLDMLFRDIPCLTLEKRELAFACSCSREKIERVLISLGARDIEELVEREGGTEVTCEFCRERYRFCAEELLALRDASLRH